MPVESDPSRAAKDADNLLDLATRSTGLHYTAVDLTTGEASAPHDWDILIGNPPGTSGPSFAGRDRRSTPTTGLGTISAR